MKNEDILIILFLFFSFYKEITFIGLWDVSKNIKFMKNL